MKKVLPFIVVGIIIIAMVSPAITTLFTSNEEIKVKVKDGEIQHVDYEYHSPAIIIYRFVPTNEDRSYVEGSFNFESLSGCDSTVDKINDSTQTIYEIRICDFDEPFILRVNKTIKGATE